jgi:flagellar basal-body rod modification protein FlgD
MQIFANPGLGKETAATQSGSGTNNNASPSAANSATVTANDFLQLLVTEMKNQDPTANTDPNEYINQLVQVNSLEQLVQINQDLGGLTDTSATGSDGGTHTSPAGPGAARPGAAALPPSPAGGTGNLSAPAPGNAAAVRVAQALGTPGTSPPGSAPANPSHRSWRP